MKEEFSAAAFTDCDLLALMYICDRSASNESSDEICAGLERGDHFEDDRHREIVYPT